MSGSKTSPGTVDRVLVLSTYGGQICILAFLLALHRMGDRPVVGPLTSLTRLVLFGSVAAGLFAAVLVWRRLRRPGAEGRSALFTLLLCVFTVVAILFMGEAVVRIFSDRYGGFVVFRDQNLLPRDWKRVAHRYGNVIREMTDEDGGSYLIYDELLGWSPAPNRTDETGLYHISAEGIRGPTAGASMLEPTVPTGQPAPTRIALIGDSFTFGAEVAYEDTWGDQLERLMGPGVRIRNFGVSGYGVDQAVLRYERDVRPWHPDLVIFGAIGHDFVRTMAVYMFTSFPRWESPFSKPRFTLREGRLVLVNRPAMPPSSIFAVRAVTDLPLLAYDGGFNPDHWRFRFYHHSLLVRYLASRFPAWRTPPESTPESMDVAAVNRAVLRRFVDLSRADGAVPVLAYLPSTSEVERGTDRASLYRHLIREVAEATGTLYADVTPALLGAALTGPVAMEWEHYTPEANGVVARHFAGLLAGAVDSMPTYR